MISIKTHFTTAALVVAISLALTGCSTFNKKTNDDLEYRKQSLMALLEKSKSAKARTAFVETNRTYLGRFDLGQNADPRPIQLSSVLFYNNRVPMELEAALNRISLDHDINIYLAEDAKVALGLIEDDSTDAENTDDESSSSGASRQVQSALSEVADVTANLVELTRERRESETLNNERYNPANDLFTLEDFNSKITLSAKDVTLAEWLDQFTLERGLHWDYGTLRSKPYIEISGLVKETLQYEGLENSVESGSVGKAADPAWAELKEFVDENISEYGHASTSDSTGRIYIQDLPANIKRIKYRVEEENRILSTEILYDLRVITFRQSENENYQLNWSTIYDDLSNVFNVSTAGSAGTGFNASYTLTNASSTFQGSNIAVNALKTLLKGGRETSSIGSVRNRTPFESSPNTTSAIVTGTSVEATEFGTVTQEEIGQSISGVSFVVLGSVLGSGGISVDLSLQLTDEISRETRSGVNGEFTLPTTYTLPLTPRFILDKGETAIFATSSSNSSASTSGVHDNAGILNALLGGTNAVSSEETLTLVLLSAKVVGA